MLPVQPPPGLSAETLVVPGRSRFETRTDWLVSRHSFSFGPHYDPANTHHGLLLVNNDDVVSPRSGFDTHSHRDMEIVTWVLEGALRHEDSAGNSGVIRPGLAQRMSAGSGIVHSEHNDTDEPVRFVQMWVVPDDTSTEPGYQQAEVDGLSAPGRLVTVASGLREHEGRAAVRIGQRYAAFHVTRLGPSDQVVLPAAPYLYVFVARGSADLVGAGRLDPGDAARITQSEQPRLRGVDDSEVLVWEMHATLGA